MYRVTYSSHASRVFSRTSLSAITTVSRRNNQRHEVTGMMIYHDRRFFQVLEGDEQTLLRLMTRIVADPRHHGVTVIEHGRIERRAFTTWRAFRCLEAVPPQEAAAFSALADLVPVNSDLRGRDPGVRQHVRTFLAGLRALPTTAPRQEGAR